jgi:hypothetical protein
MGYLNNTTVTVDAILTKKGRELLAKGASSFNITQFALADDEIDYDLWNQSHPLGDDKMGTVIENLPITEAVPDETQSMKYKLITLSEGTKAIPYIESTPSSLILTETGGARNLTTTSKPNLTLELKQWSSTGNGPLVITENPGGYTFTMLDTTYFNVLAVNTGVVELPMSGKSKTWNTTSDIVPRLEFVIGINGAWLPTTLDGKSTKLIITNTRYGSRFVVPVSFSNT